MKKHPSTPSHWGQNFLGLTLSAACLLILGACQSNPTARGTNPSLDNPSAPGTQAPSIVPEWSIHYRANCKNEEGEVQPCAGLYGWIATSLKTLEIGPAPNSRAHQESLSADAMAALEGAVFSEWENSEDSADCPLDSSAASEAARIERLIDGHVVTRCGSPAFLESIRPWVEATSPQPYPSPCWDLLADLRELQHELQGCQQDADCAYFDSSFREIEVGALELVVTRTCDRLDPLWLGNRHRVTERKDAYFGMLGRAQTACGQSFQRETCSQTEGFQAYDAIAPSCVAGRCVRH